MQITHRNVRCNNYIMHDLGIQHGIDNNFRNEVIARKIYLSFPTQVFINNEEKEFELLNSIRNHFKIPFKSIQVAGSSKTGYSYFHNRIFIPGDSDLDIAIIDPDLFRRYCEKILNETNGLRDQTNFGRHDDGSSKFGSYCKYIAKGIFRPDFMPIGETSKKWFNFFNKLSADYVDFFSDINAGLYFTEKCFELKQAENIDYYKKIML